MMHYWMRYKPSQRNGARPLDWLYLKCYDNRYTIRYDKSYVEVNFLNKYELSYFKLIWFDHS